MDKGTSMNQFKGMVEKLNSFTPGNWNDINDFITILADNHVPDKKPKRKEFLNRVMGGIAFLTYDYGIDGVSIEISKYAKALQNLFSDTGTVNIHFIGGDFFPQADSVLESSWKRFHIEGINGWSKWDNGIWFEKLFYQDMPENSKVSDEMAQEIWKQAITFSKIIGNFIVKNNISLLIPVNISSNPGNMALGLCTVLVTEFLGLYVLNSSHDYYWESGKPASEKEKDEQPGPRDHFFRNINNKAFFSVFEKLYPWNGQKWLQVNINSLQTDKLLNKYRFSKNHVFELGTALSEDFFNDYSEEDIRYGRLRMAHILSDGYPIIKPISASKHKNYLGNWMKNQRPVVCACHDGLTLDITSDKTIYFLQPTRVINRKRIEKDMHLIDALLKYPEFYKKFAANPDMQIVLHITGPVPIEHQTDLETILNAFTEACANHTADISDRLFIAFSVGNENHTCFKIKGFEALDIEDIYHLATMILFPSETEGRGLPIVESGASGIPIVCSRYIPEEVFAGVVGEGLEENKQIKYFEFPEGEFSESLLRKITDYILNPGEFKEFIRHNKKAVKLRYGSEVMEQNFKELLTKFSG